MKTPTDWSAVRAAYLETHSKRIVAEQFGLSVHTVRTRCRREGWDKSEASAQNRVIQSPPVESPSIGQVIQNTPFESDSGDQVIQNVIQNPPVESPSDGQVIQNTPVESPSISQVIQNTPVESTSGGQVIQFESPPGIPIPFEFDRADAARFYRDQLGWTIHPLYGPNKGSEKLRGKKPELAGWRNRTADQLTDEIIEKFFGTFGSANLGCVVRAPHVCIDLDSKTDDGASVREWLAGQPHLAAAPRETTCGGVHMHFLCPDLPVFRDSRGDRREKGLMARLTDVVTAELLFHGCNIVVAPSQHAKGHTYSWEVGGTLPEVTWADLQSWFGFVDPAAEKNTVGKIKAPKEKPYWAKFKGDLTTLDLVGLFREAKALGDCLDPDKSQWSVRCPWASEHSGGEGWSHRSTDTVIYNPPGETPGFCCLHAHCAERRIGDVLDHFESAKPGSVDASCKAMRVWEDGQADADGRPRILLPGTDRPESVFAAEVGDAIAPVNEWFVKNDTVVTVGVHRFSETVTSLAFKPMLPVATPTSIEEHLQTGVLHKDRDSGDLVFRSLSMNRETAASLLSAPQFKGRLPHIVRILDIPLPIRLPDGRIELPKIGYDPRFRTYCDPGCPMIRPMPVDEARALLLKIHRGFCFRDQQSITHALARVITPYCRGLMGWTARFPLWNFTANRPRAGKDYLAGITMLIYEGVTCEDAPLDGNSEETRKRITAANMAGRRMMHFANCQTHIDDPVFIGAITSHVFSARNLGSTDARADLRLPNEIEFSISANVGLTYREDVEPRCRKIALFLEQEDANARDFEIKLLHQYVLRHRADLLSAIASLVGAWIDAGCPEGRTPFTSFPQWAATVGGIMTFHGLGDPCLPHVEDGSEVGGDRADRAMRALYALCHETYPDTWIEKQAVYQVVAQAEDNDDLSFFGGFSEEESKKTKTRIGMFLKKFDRRELGGIRLELDRSTEKTQRQLVRFIRAGLDNPHPEQTAWNSFLGTLGTLENPENPKVPNASRSSSKPVGTLGTLGTLYTSGGVESGVRKEKEEEEKEIHIPFPPEVGAKVPKVPKVPKTRVHQLVTDPGRLPEIAALLEPEFSIALDVETYGPRKSDALDPWRGDIRLLQLAGDRTSVFLLDLQAIGYDLGPLATLLSSKPVIGHNIKFDALWLLVKCGIRLPRVFCTLTAARLLSAGTKPGNNLDLCLERYLGLPPAPDQSRSDWGAMLLTNDQIAYAARDVSHLHMLKGVLCHELEMAGLDGVADLEMRLLPAVIDMERAGMAVDADKLRAIESVARASAEAAAKEVRTALGLPNLNLASPKQLLPALAARGIPLSSTNEESLQSCGDMEVIPKILLHRSFEKQAQQAASLLESVAPDGRIHGRFDPTGTATGRFSSKSPNLQNIGRGELRSCFIAPEGRSLVVADYSQVELRVAAALAGEQKMVDAYAKGEDLHRLTAATVLGKPLADVTKDDRQMAKACFSGDTELLTAHGWVRFDRYDGVTPVAQYCLPDGVFWNPPRPRSNRWGHPTGKVHWDGNGTMEFVRPLDFRSFEDREVVRQLDRNSDLLVTPDHQIAFLSNVGNPCKVRADKIAPGNCRHLIAAGFLRREPSVTADFTRAIAMIVADGSFSNCRTIRLGFSKQRKVRRCLELLSRLDLVPRVSVSGRVTSITITDEDFTQDVLRWVDRRKDLSWDALTGLDAAAYLDEAAHWDSYQLAQRNHTRVLFCTISAQTANVMQAMAATTGCPSVLSCHPKANPNHSDLYHLSYRLEGSPLWRASWNLQTIPDRQTVHCVQVPAGAILVRRNGKVTVQGNCNFGLLYGQNAKGLVRYAKTSYGVDLTEDEARAIRQKFFATYGHLRQWHGLSHQQAERGIEEVRTITGRRRLIPSTASAWERFTALVNTPVQGGSADGIKQALVDLSAKLPEGAKIISTVHDEIIVECDEAQSEPVSDLLASVMRDTMQALFPQVPIEVEARACANWGEKP